MEKDLGLIRFAQATVIFYWFDTDQEVMINRSSWGHSYYGARGEILRPS
jgi:hypothetical protein